MNHDRYFFIGVDPGKTGAVALIDNLGVPQWIDDLPTLGGVLDAKALVEMLKEPQGRIAAAAIERTQALPQTPRSVCHSLGFSEGLALAALLMLDVRVLRPRPVEWKRAMRVPADKAKAKEMAELMFPSMRPWLRRVSDHNRAEALLLADYARRMWEKAES